MCAVVCIVCVVGGRASGESARREMGVGAFRLGFACLSVCLSVWQLYSDICINIYVNNYIYIYLYIVKHLYVRLGLSGAMPAQGRFAIV